MLGFEPELHHRGGLRRLRRSRCRPVSSAPSASWPPSRPSSERSPREGAAVGDAEIIPIGTRGKPGRGTGETKPSSNSRSLAAKAAGPATSGRPGDHAAASSEPATDDVRVPAQKSTPAAPRTGKAAAAKSSKSAKPAGPTPVSDAGSGRLGPRGDREARSRSGHHRPPPPGPRHPAAGVAGRADLRLQGAVRRQLGAAPRAVPGVPAPPAHGRLHRRRLRLRPGDHRAVHADRAAPDRAEVVPRRGPRRREHPRRRRRARSSPTTPARSRSTA